MNEQMENAAMKPLRESKPSERWLVLGALGVAIMFDIFVLRQPYESLRSGYAIFWLAYLAVYYIFNWQSAKGRFEAWYVAGACALTLVWKMLYSQKELQALTFVLLPIVLMLHAQLGVLRETQPMTLFANVFFGFFAEPFTAIGKLFVVLAGMFSNKSQQNKRFSQVAIGIVVAIPLALIVLALLFDADAAMSYYAAELLADWNFGDAITHFILICTALILFYSFLWNLKFSPDSRYNPKPPAPARLEPLVVGIVLGVLLAIYLLFSIIQAAFLFGGMRLPDGLTYSEYARSGFFQLIVASALNFAIFAFALRFTKPSAAIRYLLLGLLVATCILLTSGVTRLSMYIAEYGLTWLRVVSMWFMVYLACVLVLGGVRLFNPKLKLMKVCAAALMAAALLLAFVNVDKVIARYNISIDKIVGNDSGEYIFSLSNDCIDELIAYSDANNGESASRLRERLAQLRSGAYTLSDFLALQKLEAWAGDVGDVGEGDVGALPQAPPKGL